MVIAVGLGSFLLEFVFAKIAVSLNILSLKVFNNLVESFLTGMLVKSLFCNIVNGLIKFLVDLLAEFLIVDFMV